MQITEEGGITVATTTTVVAVNASHSSQCAVKWAVEHFLQKNSSCILIHVRTKPKHYHEGHDDDDVSTQGRPPTEEELHRFFLPFRGFCARKGIEAKELVLHDIDVPSALTHYIEANSIDDVVVGSATSTFNAFLRRFKDTDLATNLAKSLPKTCTLHVISKGKVQTIQPTGQPHQNCQSHKNVAQPKSIRDIVTLMQNSLVVHPNKFVAHTPDSESIYRKPSNDASGKDFLLTQNPNVEDNNSPRGPKLSTASSSQMSSNPSSPDNSTDSDLSNLSTKPPKNLEVEIRKLKRELKKTTKQYGMVCKEAVLAKQKATELEKCREEKERNVERAKLAEEAALSLAEVERQKAKAALETAEMSQRLAEMETEKRMQAEIKAKRENEERRKALQVAVYNNIPYRRYDIKEIEVATNGFDTALKIGEGGYGPVFKGVLDHTVVAIKALRPDLAHGERQFQQEVVVLSTIRHPNMVLLLGACPEFGCLVYEYLECGSLEDCLLQNNDTPPIPLKTRFKIASEIATGLLFLHQAKPQPLVHRDLKPANILLDKNYVSKISDVGLARLVPPSVANKTTQYRLTGAAGTFCYIDPEYQQTGLLGVKSDIYSLGVVLLQIITAKPPMGLSHLVEEAIEEGNFTDVLDPRVSDWPVEEALSFAKLALKCCELRKRDRPDLATVILPELNRISQIFNCED